MYKLKQSAEVIADSTFHGTRITTFRLRYWRAIHGEVMTHRVFSRNAASSRARPVKAVMGQVLKNPAGPIFWASNKAGMQAGEQLSPFKQKLASILWVYFAYMMVIAAWLLLKLGVHKQWVNRLLEAFQYMETIVTTTETDNFYALRCHKDAQPEFQDLANKMLAAQNMSRPRALLEGEWHLPFITDDERQKYHISSLIKMSTARAARVSYKDFDGTVPTFIRDIGTYDKLMGATPIHGSPAEHPARAAIGKWANFTNFRSHRHFVESQIDWTNEPLLGKEHETQELFTFNRVNDFFNADFMAIAHNEALKSCCKRGRVGAIVVNSLNMSYTKGHNHNHGNECEDGQGLSFDTVRHAERVALDAMVMHLSVAGDQKQYKNWCVLFTTRSPCKACAQAIIDSGVVGMVIYSSIHDGTNGLVLLEDAGIRTLYNDGVEITQKNCDEFTWHLGAIDDPAHPKFKKDESSGVRI